MRLIISGGGSFIARSVADICRASTIKHVILRHDEPLDDVLETDDCLINFAIDPRYRSGPYSEDYDQDLSAAHAAVRAGASFTMLSTRRVYGPEMRWNATEGVDVVGDETVYGRNKAHSEAAVQRICNGKAGIFRLSNIFGYEYSSAVQRRSFLGQLLNSLKRQNIIFFDMHPATRRDFLPVESCAELLVARAIGKDAGIYNLGSGFATSCGELAAWIMEGFGGGELVCDPMIVRDEFFLNMSLWRSHFELPVSSETVRNYCVELGRRLQCEKS